MRYRLTAATHPPLTDSRLALVVGQAVALARRGLHPRVVDEDGEGITVDKDDGVLVVTWVPAPTSLFDEMGQPPAWLDTAREIIATVYEDGARREEPHGHDR